jgi:nucleoside-diphosphate-sugar epimerase
MLGERGEYSLFVATTDVKKYAGVEYVAPVSANLLSAVERESLFAETRPEILVHLAWDQRDASFKGGSSNLEWLAAGLDILRLFGANGGRRAIFAGSSSEYEAYSGGFAEDGAKRPMSQYGACKLALTDAALPYAAKFGIGLAVARYFTIYGENDSHEFGAIPMAIRSFSEGEPVRCNAPYAIRDYVYAGDAAAATVAILESGFSGIINVASGRPRTMKEVFKTIAEEMGCERLLSFNENLGRNDVFVAQTSRLNDEIGFACATDFRDGIRRCVERRRRPAETRV